MKTKWEIFMELKKDEIIEAFKYFTQNWKDICKGVIKVLCAFTYFVFAVFTCVINIHIHGDTPLGNSLGLLTMFGHLIVIITFLWLRSNWIRAEEIYKRNLKRRQNGKKTKNKERV